MKVLIFGLEFYPIIGGGGSYVSNLAKGLSDNGAKVALVTSGVTDSIDSVSQYLKIYHIKNLYNLYYGKGDLIRAVELLIKIIRDEKPDVISTHHSLASLIGQIANVNFGVPLFITHHKTPNYNRDLKKIDGKWSTYNFVNQTSLTSGYIAPSLFFKESLLENGVQENNITLIYPGVDINQYHQIDKNDVRLVALGKKLGLKTDDHLILVPTLIRKRKGLKFICQSLSKANSKYQLRLLITGLPTSQSEREILSEAKSFLYKDILIKHNHSFTDQEMPLLYNLATVTVLPSEAEGLGISLLEAIACGCPIIGTDVPGIHEIVEDGINGRLIAFGDVSAMGEAINEIIENISIRQKYIDGGFRTLETKFNQKVEVQKYLATFSSYINEHKQSSGGILFRRTDKIEVFLASHSNYGLVLPKGSKKSGETWIEAAIREIREETGYSVTNPKFSLGKLNYTFEKDGNFYAKEVAFHAFEVKINQQAERLHLEENELINKGKWLEISEAIEASAFDDERDLIKKLKKLLSKKVK